MPRLNFLPHTSDITAVFTSLSLILLTCVPVQFKITYRSDPSGRLRDRSLTAVYVPLLTISSSIKDRTSRPEPVEYNDSFFTTVANEITMSELSRNFNSVHAKTLEITPDSAMRKDSASVPGSTADSSNATAAGPSVRDDTIDTAGEKTALDATGQNSIRKSEMGFTTHSDEGWCSPRPPEVTWSILNGDTAVPRVLIEQIIDISHECKAGLIVIPIGCCIQQTATQERGWRDDKYGPSYARPVKYYAEARFHVQIWDGKGILLYERIGKGSSGRPLLYRLFKRDPKKSETYTAFARRVFAPPLVKALNEAVVDALKLY